MIIDSIKEDVKKALKEKRGEEATTLRTLMSDIKNYQIKKFAEDSKKTGLVERKQDEVPSDEEIISVLTRGLKQMEENFSIFIHGKREDLLEAEKHKITIYKRYMPAQMTAEDLEKVIDGILPMISGKTPQERFGLAMRSILPVVKGRVDGKLVSEIVRKKLEI